MTTLIEIHTFLQKYFGNALSRFFQLFVRKARNNVTKDAQTETIAPDDGDAPHVEPVTPDTSAEAIKPSSSELLNAVVADTIALPSLPSILTKPEARPPLPVENVFEVQDFGRPSNVFHDRRTALGCITNIPGENIKAGTARGAKTKTKTKSKSKSKSITKESKSKKESKSTKEAKPVVVNYSLPTRSRKTKKHSRSRSHPAPEVEPVVAVAVSEVSFAPAPAPCSPGWNKAKDDIIAEMQSFNKQVLASRRHSMPVLAATPSPDVVAVKTTKRHSAPPVLVASSDKIDVEDLLSGLMRDAEATLVVLDKELDNTAATPIKTDIEDIKACTRPFSAIAPEASEDIFVIGNDTDDEEEYYCGAGLPTLAYDTPTKSKSYSGFGNFKLVSSISASRSMAELANASSRSISDLLEVWDGMMRSPKLARFLSRWDGVTRRNDSVV
ncbi:hypothetical protein FB45DRAFT_1034588 [Roridomyces roridus]|uniref:Uncharacterized protein n=1 Tax=Roridomyces roridus TaxID=1738132 RepID=A0AAD7BDA4_9AGAR|nr:hypothetical protein FB45DRAFT_1034588 [Roridomyces roridus]